MSREKFHAPLNHENIDDNQAELGRVYPANEYDKFCGSI